ncbi:MAG: YqaE/Pmp3 family membrane protein [Patescibacteria group bacterium]
MSQLIMVILAVLLPPLAVFLTVGFTLHFWINVILTILGYLPGIVHALWVVLTF